MSGNFARSRSRSSCETVTCPISSPVNRFAHDFIAQPMSAGSSSRFPMEGTVSLIGFQGANGSMTPILYYRTRFQNLDSRFALAG